MHFYKKHQRLILIRNDLYIRIFCGKNNLSIKGKLNYVIKQYISDIKSFSQNFLFTNLHKKLWAFGTFFAGQCRILRYLVDEMKKLTQHNDESVVQTFWNVWFCCTQNLIQYLKFNSKTINCPIKYYSEQMRIHRFQL